ncbi:glycoside hydrolase family 10 protein [Euzebya tangerina]|uniref:glycoside hydrolase family 10 protein n=1 Tax=Euzebya tangerina TaxID=591198 RepID=UPI000E3122B8|nr:family 10 glycosylhydrolase [Euzebya tangerina]
MSPTLTRRTITLLLTVIVAIIAMAALLLRVPVAGSTDLADQRDRQPSPSGDIREAPMDEVAAAQLSQGVLETSEEPTPEAGPPPPADPTAVPVPTPLATAPQDQPTDGPPVEPTFPARIQGVWVHVLDDVLLTRGSITGMLDRVVAGGGNTVVVEVGRRYDVYYDSGFLPRAGDLGFEPGLDVLAEVASQARDRGISVHAWYTAMPAWTPETAKNPDAEPNWTFTQHGRDAAPEDTWLTFNQAGEPSDFLDPGHPAVQDLVVATAAELARYDIDAVHLDYLRYPGAEYGYNPTALGRFQAETGRTDIPAPDDPEFSDWRRAQTTLILQRVNQVIDVTNPEVGVSAALIAWGDGPIDGRPFESTPAFSQVYQPWHQWMAGDLVDVAMPMLYFRESRHAAFHRNWMSYVAGIRNATGVTTAPGQGSWLNTPEESVLQLTAAQPFVDGEVLFSYQETAVDTGPEGLLGGALARSVWSDDQ